LKSNAVEASTVFTHVGKSSFFVRLDVVGSFFSSRRQKNPSSIVTKDTPHKKLQRGTRNHGTRSTHHHYTEVAEKTGEEKTSGRTVDTSCACSSSFHSDSKCVEFGATFIL